MNHIVQICVSNTQFEEWKYYRYDNSPKLELTWLPLSELMVQPSAGPLMHTICVNTQGVMLCEKVPIWKPGMLYDSIDFWHDKVV